MESEILKRSLELRRSSRTTVLDGSLPPPSKEGHGNVRLKPATDETDTRRDRHRPSTYRLLPRIEDGSIREKIRTSEARRAEIGHGVLLTARRP